MRPFLPNERVAPSNAIRSQLAEAIVRRERSPKGAAGDARRAGDVKTAEAIEKSAVTFTATQSAFNQPNYVTDVAAFVGLSAFKEVVAADSVKVNFDDQGSSVAVSNNSPATVDFIQQGAPIKVKSGSISSTVVAPRKVGVVHVFTRQLLQSSNAMPLVRRGLEEGVPKGLDAIMLDANAADDARPAGFRYGVSAETSGGANAMLADLTLLASKVADVAGNLANIIFIADPRTAIKIALALPFFKFKVVASSGLAAGTVIALAANAVLIGAGSEIRFETSETTALHMEDATPADIGVVGSPANIVSAPVRSMFQTDCIAAKFIFNVDFKLRAANAVSHMASVAW